MADALPAGQREAKIGALIPNSPTFLEEPSHLISGVSFPFLLSPTPKCDGLGFRVSCPGFESPGCTSSCGVW